MSEKQTVQRFKRVWTIAINWVLLLLLVGTGEYRTEDMSISEPIPEVAVLTAEPVPTVRPLRATVVPSMPRPIPIAAVAGKTNPLPTADLPPKATTIKTVKPAPTYKSTSVSFASALPHLTPTRLIIPAIELNAPIIATKRVNLEINGQSVTTWAVPDTFAAGWHYTSALPGQIGNTVINGHSNVYGEVFRYLERLQQNDEIIVYVDDTAYHYHVTDRYLLEEENLSWEFRTKNIQLTMPTEDERLTLITCAPYPRNTHRLIVVALPAQPDSSLTLATP
jgi:LPXTG-site transpeptidase (sortase) family protein